MVSQGDMQTVQNDIIQIKSDLVSLAQKADTAISGIQDTDNRLRTAFEDALRISVQERVREEELIKSKVEEIIRVRDTRENEFKKRVEDVIRVRDNYAAVIASSVDQHTANMGQNGSNDGRSQCISSERSC